MNDTSSSPVFAFCLPGHVVMTFLSNIFLNTYLVPGNLVGFWDTSVDDTDKNSKLSWTLRSCKIYSKLTINTKQVICML